MGTLQPGGRSLGVAGGGLDNAPWAANASAARVGQAGELRTANILNSSVSRRGGATVLHDLIIPGSRANVDHVVVVGRTVWVIDTKVWAPGFYWRVGERAYRGTERFELAERRTTSLAVARLRSYLQRSGVVATFANPTVVVWPSSARGRLSLALLRRVGNSPVVGGEAFRWAVRSMTSTRGLLRRHKTADPELVTALSKLLVTVVSPCIPATVTKAASHISAVTGASGFEDAPAPPPASAQVGRVEADPFGDLGDDGFGEC